MADQTTPCPVCGERLALQGLSFFMANLAIDKHSKASPGCKLRVEFFPEDQRFEIKKASDGDNSRGDAPDGPGDVPPSRGWRLIR